MATDADEFTAILAAFPMTSAQVQALHHRADALLITTGGTGAYGKSLNEREWHQLSAFTAALRDLHAAAVHIENDTDPRDDEIPF